MRHFQPSTMNVVVADRQDRTNVAWVNGGKTQRKVFLRKGLPRYLHSRGDQLWHGHTPCQIVAGRFRACAEFMVGAGRGSLCRASAESLSWSGHGYSGGPSSRPRS